MPPSDTSAMVELQCSHCTALLHDDTTREILEELDRERTRRAELEAQLRELQLEMSREDTMTISRQHYIALQTELKGYRDLINVITNERPAIATALKVHDRQRLVPSQFDHKTPPRVVPKSLPLHVIRLLEIMPWDPRAKEYAFGKEELYEWQFYDPSTKKWRNEVSISPKQFRQLPTAEPTGTEAFSNGSINTTNGLLALFQQDSVPPSSCVLTNQSMTKLYNLQKGYPLPENGGTWQWVGGWKVEKRIAFNQDLQQQSNITTPKLDCDDQGWSYAQDPSDFVVSSQQQHCWDHAENKNGLVARPVRRRKWTRQRALVDYPHCCEQTKSFLTLMTQCMYANMAANKLSQQLVTTKVALTTHESVLLQCQEESKRQQVLLKELMKPKSKSKMVSNADDAKAIVVAVLDVAQQVQRDVEQALTTVSTTMTAHD